MKKNQIYFRMILSNKIYNMTNKRYVSYPKSIKQVWLTVKHNYLSKMININERRKWRKKHHVFHMFYPHKNCLTILNAIKSKKLSYSLTKLILNNFSKFLSPQKLPCYLRTKETENILLEEKVFFKMSVLQILTKL